jgi:hypothetical protein
MMTEGITGEDVIPDLDSDQRVRLIGSGDGTGRTPFLVVVNGIDPDQAVKHGLAEAQLVGLTLEFIASLQADVGSQGSLFDVIHLSIPPFYYLYCTTHYCRCQEEEPP